MRISYLCTLVFLAGCSAPSTDAWLEQLKDTEVVKRRQAIRELAVRTDDADRIVPALIEAVADDNGYVRHDAALALGKFGAEARPAVPVLLAALRDEARNVRVAAGLTLKRIDNTAAQNAGVR